MTDYFARHALLPNGVACDVRFEVADGRFTAITTGSEPEGATVLPGLVAPGFANGHSHAFHRALRGRTHAGGGTFWTWRTGMYALANRLDPDSYLALARATYAEMVLAGYTAVGEFHYLHHQPGGRPYDEPNLMAEALRRAAAEAGIRLTLLDTCYLAGGLGSAGYLPLAEEQLRFGDGTVDAWAERVTALGESDGMLVGAAIHSVRAVPPEALSAVRVVAGERPLHLHLSEQPAENKAALAHFGCTPSELLGSHGVLGRTTTAVHATHLGPHDLELLGSSGTTACLCPTTERDLADGIGPARALADAGAPLAIGSDQQVSIDPFEEARGIESHERLSSLQRGRFSPSELLVAMTAHGSLGWTDAGRLEVDARADLVAVRTDSVRTAGASPDQVLLAASAADVDTVIIDGTEIVRDRQHRLGDVGRLLADAISPLWSDA